MHEAYMTRFPPKAERLQRMNNQLQLWQRELATRTSGKWVYPAPLMTLSHLRYEIRKLQEAMKLTANEDDD
jgi:hypothetical protein